MKKSVAIIGGGPTALLLASFLDPTQFDVTIFEKNKSLGRKFLVAGKGGFNLTHSEPLTDFIKRYTPSSFLEKALSNFTNEDLRIWFESIGVPTFIGSSNRVYPIKGIKPIEVLNTITKQLISNKVKIQYQSTWNGWSDNKRPLINQEEINTEHTIFALGGGSWKVTGSDGLWLDVFKAKGIKTSSFIPSNCAYQILWKKEFLDKNEGTPLKNISISCKQQTQKGEVVITNFGIEGNAIYALSPQIQNLLKTEKVAEISIDLKPMLSEESVLERLRISKAKNISNTLKNDLKLGSCQVDLLKFYLSKEEYLDLNTLSKKIKELPLQITKASPLDEAISTTGGIELDQVDSNFELKELKNTFCVGEMLNWNAPTGGYLLQACFSMGVHLAKHLNQK